MVGLLATTRKRQNAKLKAVNTKYKKTNLFKKSAQVEEDEEGGGKVRALYNATDRLCARRR